MILPPIRAAIAAGAVDPASISAGFAPLQARVAAQQLPDSAAIATTFPAPTAGAIATATNAGTATASLDQLRAAISASAIVTAEIAAQVAPLGADVETATFTIAGLVDVTFPGMTTAAIAGHVVMLQPCEYEAVVVVQLDSRTVAVPSRNALVIVPLDRRAVAVPKDEGKVPAMTLNFEQSKDPSDDSWYVFRFQEQLLPFPGTATATPLKPGATPLIIGDHAVAANLYDYAVKLSGGQAGVTYRVRIGVDTVSGSQLFRSADLRVENL